MNEWGARAANTLSQRGLRLQGEPAFVVARPQVDGFAIGTRSAVQAKRVQVKGGPHGTELERRHTRPGHLAAYQVHQQGGDQRAMHNETRIAFFLRHISAVVMDAVPVEGERRITKQRHRVGHKLALPRCADLSRGGRHFGRTRGMRQGRCAVHDVVCFGQAQPPGVVKGVLNLDKQQVARAARLVFDRRDARVLLRGVAHAQWVAALPLHAAAGPHAAGQRHGRQKATAQGVAIGPDLALWGLRQKVQPMPQRRHFGACGLAGIVPVEQGALATQGRGHDLVAHRFAAAFPAAQVGHLLGAQGGGRGVVHGGYLRPVDVGCLSVLFKASVATSNRLHGAGFGKVTLLP